MCTIHQIHTLPAPQHLARDFGYPAEKSEKPVYYIDQNEEGPYSFDPAADTKTR